MESFVYTADKRERLARNLSSKVKISPVECGTTLEDFTRDTITVRISGWVGGRARKFAIMCTVTEFMYRKERAYLEQHMVTDFKHMLYDRLAHNKILTKPKGKLPE